MFAESLFTIVNLNVHPRWMDKENVVYAYNGILFSHKKKEILSYATMWINLKPSLA
jgi:hypothetical protein